MTSPVILKFESAAEPPGGFVRTQMLGPTPRGDRLPGDVDAVGPKNCCSQSLSFKLQLGRNFQKPLAFI